MYRHIAFIVLALLITWQAQCAESPLTPDQIRKQLSELPPNTWLNLQIPWKGGHEVPAIFDQANGILFKYGGCHDHTPPENIIATEGPLKPSGYSNTCYGLAIESWDWIQIRNFDASWPEDRPVNGCSRNYCYDSKRKVMWMYGGVCNGGGGMGPWNIIRYDRETDKFTEMLPANPPPKGDNNDGDEVVYDPANDLVIMPKTTTTWIYHPDNNTWEKRINNMTIPWSGHYVQMVFDPSINKLVYIIPAPTGKVADQIPANSTSRWQPVTRGDKDGPYQELTMDAFTYDVKANLWAKLPIPVDAQKPSTRWRSGVTFDSENKVIILVGGSTNTWDENEINYNDVWILNTVQAKWTPMNPKISPPTPARECRHCAYVDALNIVLYAVQEGTVWAYRYKNDGSGNSAPTIGSIGDQKITVGGTAGPVAFTIGDAETPAANLTISKGCTNTTLAPLNNIILGGGGANRTVSVTAAAGQVGTAIITLTVSDGSLTARESFAVAVAPVNNMAPVLESAPWADPAAVALSNSTQLHVLASDSDAGPSALSYTWSKVNGPGTVNFDSNGTNNSNSTQASFSAVGTYTLHVTVSDGKDAVSGDVSVTVSADDESPTIVTVTQMGNPAAEPAQQGSIEFHRQGGNISQPLTIEIELGGCSAKPGIDFEALPATVTFPANSKVATLPVIPIDDSQVEGREWLTVSVKPSTKYQRAKPYSAIVDIHDDEKPSVWISTAVRNAYKDGTPGLFVVRRSPATDKPLTVYYSVSGSAAPGTDYTKLSGSIVIPESETSVSITIDALRSDVGLRGKTVKVTLSKKPAYNVRSSGATVIIKR